MEFDIAQISRGFILDGDFVTAERYGTGHINDTFKMSTTRQTYILQRINTSIFREPEKLMDNFLRVSKHIEGKIAAEKAGIIKPGVPVFYGNLCNEAKQVIEQKATELGCAVCAPAENVPEKAQISESDSGFIQTFEYCGKTVSLSLGGRMQRENFRMVYHVLEYLDIHQEKHR